MLNIYTISAGNSLLLWSTQKEIWDIATQYLVLKYDTTSQCVLAV